MPGEEIASAIIGGGSSLLGSGINVVGNMMLADQQNKQNIEMWNRQNQYNLPINQMKRLEAAGLNPALVYGKGNATTLAGSPPLMQRANVDVADPSGSISNWQQVQNLSKQNALIDQEIRRAKAEADVAQHDATIINAGATTKDAPWWVKALQAPLKGLGGIKVIGQTPIDVGEDATNQNPEEVIGRHAQRFKRKN